MALIKTIAELKAHLPVAYSNGVSTLPAFDVAEARYLQPILGDALLAQLQAAYDATTMSSAQTALIKKCRAVIAPFAYAINLPFIQTLLTDNGLIALEADQSRKAFKWEYNNVVEAFQVMGYSAQESLITFLQINQGDYTLWASSPYNDVANFGLIRNGADLKNVTGLQQPHRVYSLIKPVFESVELQYLRGFMGDDFYEALNGRIIGGTTTPTDDVLVKILRQVAGRRAMEIASIEMCVQYSGSGFTVTDGTRARDIESEGKLFAPDPAMKRFTEHMQMTANAYTQQAIDYMNKLASVSVFTEYFASTQYTNPVAEPTPRHNNDTRNGMFVAG